MAGAVLIEGNYSPELEGLFSGLKWDSETITWSAPTNGSQYGARYGFGENQQGFDALTLEQVSAVRAVMALYASYTDLEIRYVAGAGARSADIRIAQSSEPNTAWSYFPDRDEGGDVWFNAGRQAYDKPVVGSYGWLTFLHEIGHAFGLKHGHEALGGFDALPDELDTLEFTVMTYRSYEGASDKALSNGSADYPQTLMMGDIHALQTLYGANFTKTGAALVYSWTPNSGETFINGVSQWAVAGDRIFLTVWSAGAEVTYDLSKYDTGVQIDLRPGAWSTFSNDQLARLDRTGAHLARGNVANAELVEEGPLNNLIANAIGGAGDDVILANDADNRLTGGAGDDWIDGGAGEDTAVFSGRMSDYAWARDGVGWSIVDLRSDGDGRDTLNNIEWLQFADQTIALTASSVQRPPAGSAHGPGASATPEVVTLDIAEAYQHVLWKPAPDELPTDLQQVIDAADLTTSVATMTYQFFTGKIPTEAGMDWLMAAEGGNATNLNSSYFADWGVEQRFINFAVNLASSEVGAEFREAFDGLSAETALVKAYEEIFGWSPSADKVDVLLHADVDPGPVITTRQAYFEEMGGQGVGAAAAMVGWLLAEAVKADEGIYAEANNAFLVDLADGADLGIDLIGVYAPSPMHIVDAG